MRPDKSQPPLHDSLLVRDKHGINSRNYNLTFDPSDISDRKHGRHRCELNYNPKLLLICYMNRQKISSKLE